VPRFEPFTGLRYDPDAVHLNRVIAPPYDVITPDERAVLAARDPANAVRVELPEPNPGSALDRYQTAAKLLDAWQASGVLRTDPVPALYPYRMTPPEGRPTTGVIGALGPSLDGRAPDIWPHEETLPKARSDRLELLAATRANLSPIWGLSLARGLTEALDLAGPPATEAIDDDGVRHELWVLSAPDAVEAVATRVAAAGVVLADGHHRYETALTFARQERERQGPGPGAADLVMALVVELAEDQLAVGAIHRGLAGLPEGFDLPGALGRWFDLVRAGAPSDRVVGALGDAGSLALITSTDAWLLTPHADAVEAAGSDLDSALVALALADLPPHEVTFRHSWREAAGAVGRGRDQAALLLRPVTVAQIAAWAEAGRRMPPKTTYFAPKPRTGMVFRLLGS